MIAKDKAFTLFKPFKLQRHILIGVTECQGCKIRQRPLYSVILLKSYGNKK